MRYQAVVCFIFLLTPLMKAQESIREKTFQYVAHRGASYLAPENTMASIRLAWELGADAAECDVRLTADKRVVLFHDENTETLTGKNLPVKEAEWDQLKPLVVLPRKTNFPEYKHETIPLLEDVLATIPADRMLVIEIKTGPEILPYLRELIAHHWKSGKISFIAFDFETIREAKTLFPEIPCYFLSSSGAVKRSFRFQVAGNFLEGISYISPFEIINPNEKHSFILAGHHDAGMYSC